MQVELRQVTLPDFGVPTERPEIPPAEFATRCDALHRAVGTDWVVVYGDREHFANLTWLSGYDPRFEEALLLLGPLGQRALVVGIEGLLYGKSTGLAAERRFYHPFSIIGQPHIDSPPLTQLLGDAGLAQGESVGVVCWKTADPRDINPTVPAFVPVLVIRAIEGVTGTTAIDATSHMIDPVIGLRSHNSAAQIALFEWGASRASAAVLRTLRAARPGMTELEAAGHFGLQGEPTTMHPIVSTSDGELDGLRSPSARVMAHGDAITAGVGLWGGLCCRAGVLTEVPEPQFWSELAQPYFRAIATWWSTVGIGVTGGELVEAVRIAIGDAPFQPFVNPGHLTSYDEWLHSFSLAGNQTRVGSGMAMQCDIIPTPLPPGRTINCEDSLAIADELLRGEIRDGFPAVWSRIQARRTFMTDTLGITLRPEVLPLGTMPAYLPPAWLSPETVCVVTG